jgi:hypothetical protein
MNAFFIAPSTSQTSQTGQKYSQNYAFSAISKHAGLQILRTSDGKFKPSGACHAFIAAARHSRQHVAGDPRISASHGRTDAQEEAVP